MTDSSKIDYIEKAKASEDTKPNAFRLKPETRNALDELKNSLHCKNQDELMNALITMCNLYLKLEDPANAGRAETLKVVFAAERSIRDAMLHMLDQVKLAQSEAEAKVQAKLDDLSEALVSYKKKAETAELDRKTCAAAEERSKALEGANNALKDQIAALTEKNRLLEDHVKDLQGLKAKAALSDELKAKLAVYERLMPEGSVTTQKSGK